MGRDTRKQEVGELETAGDFSVIFDPYLWKQLNVYNQGLHFDDMLSFFPCEIDDAVQYINLGYGVQPPKVVIL